LPPRILQRRDLVLIDARHGIDLLVLQLLLLKVGDCLCPLLKVDVLHLHMVLKVDNPVGTDIHLLMGDVEQYTGVVPPTLSLTKTTVSILQLTVLL
jgi:hypothetical protein